MYSPELLRAEKYRYADLRFLIAVWFQYRHGDVYFEDFMDSLPECLFKRRLLTYAQALSKLPQK